jgi:PAS domain S-box-containing protein
MTQPATIPDNKAERIARLRMLKILDNDPEAIFDSLTRLASEIFEVPIALVSLVDTGRQWFNENVGLLGVTETSREIAFCSHAIHQAGVMEVPDARLDERFAANPLITGDPGIRFQAGTPIILSDSSRLGTLCVTDSTQRNLTSEQRIMLAELANALSHDTELREVTVSERATKLEESTAKVHLENDVAAISHRSHLLRATIDACPVAVTIADMATPDTQVLYASPMYSSLTGYHADEVIGHDCHHLSGKIIGDVTAATLRKKIAAGEQTELEIVKHRKDGSAFLSRLILAPILGDNGELMACIGLLSNITSEAQRRDAVEHQREKMAALGRAMGGVAHEINNMLQPVSLIVQDAIDNHLVSPEGAEHWGIVLDCARNARSIIGDVLAFSKPASRSGEIHEFTNVFKEILPLAIQDLAKGVTLCLCIKCPSLLIEISQAKFSQIIVNLVSNAASASGGSGQLTIQLDEHVFRSLTVARKAVRLRVIDTGCGMDATTLDRAFEPFYTTKGISQGTGVGLPLVYSLVQEAGGIIKLESAPGEGTTVTILIPIAEES